MFFNYIRIVLTLIVLTLSLQIRGQGNLPSVCLGTTGEYWVKGLNGHSDFEWKIIDEDGNQLDQSYYTIIGRGDTIRMNWSTDLNGGIYTFTVTEHNDFGCTGEPYSQDIVVNSQTINIPFEGVPSSISVCYGEQAELNPGNFKNYLWQDGTTNQIYYTGESGTYKVRLIDNNNSCSYNDIEAKINPLPYVWLGNDTILFGNQTLKLDAFNPNISFYTWSNGDINSSITVDGLSGNQEVWVKVEDYNGCKNSDTINIKSDDYNNLKIPSAFTPNGDGINDKWYFPSYDRNFDVYLYIDEVDVNVYNRWGLLVWRSSNNFIAWDGRDLNGRELPMDSYHYIIRFKINTNVYVYKGSITIIR